MRKPPRAGPRPESGEYRGAPPRAMIVTTLRVRVERLAREMAVLVGTEDAALILGHAAAALLPPTVTRELYVEAGT